jgi:hypothetical protein
MFHDANYSIPLNAKFDRNQRKYYIGRANNPAKISFKRGSAIFIFTSEEGTEELQFGIAKEKSITVPIKKKMGDNPQWMIALETKLDKNNRPYLFAVVQEDIEIDLAEDDGYVFFVFNSEVGSETLQFSKNRESYRDKVRDYNSRRAVNNGTEIVKIRGNRASGAYESESGEYPQHRDARYG